MRRILCLYLPYLSIERARRDAAQENDDHRPLVLTRPAGSSQVVEQVCPRAEQLGLRPGLLLAQARAMAPGLVAWPLQPVRDRATLQRLARWALRFSPIVQPVEPNTLLIDITGCQRLFSGEENLARQALAGLARQGFRARGAIADTVGAAIALAVAGSELLSIVPVGQTSAWLAPLPPAALRIDPQTSERLEALGIRSIGDLLTLPRASLPARFGPQLVLRLQQALGEVFEGLASDLPPEIPFARWSFAQPATDWQTIRSVAGHLLADLFEQLRCRGLALRRLECLLHYEHLPPRVVSIGLAQASRQPQHVAELLSRRLELIDLTPGITGLSLVARETSRFHGQQGELFQPRNPDDQKALGCLIDRLVGRLGYEAVLRPQLVDDYQPEMAFRYVSVAEAGCQPQELPAGYVPDRRPARPLRLRTRPVPIRAIALMPEGPPTWFSYRGREYLVARADGPERLETAWWRGPDIRRDYFRVTAETGEQFWLFRTVSEGRWYLHGDFA